MNDTFQDILPAVSEDVAVNVGDIEDHRGGETRLAIETELDWEIFDPLEEQGGIDLFVHETYLSVIEKRGEFTQ